MARLEDRTILYSEDRYTDLTPASTVGQALATNKYLSDDPLVVRGVLRPIDLNAEILIPDLAIGRLVETPEEIIQAIATYISQDGILDLALTDDKILVTAYDFLRDSGRRIREDWNTAFGLSDAPRTAFVNGELTSPDWDAGTLLERRQALRNRMATGYRILNLNGHATHYEEGVPGQHRFDIQGLPTPEIYGPDACGTPSSGALDLAGSIVYAVGCHGGLSVPGSCATDADRSLDLPQTFLARGACAYLANSGFGWGLKKGVGLSERLVVLLTEELTRGGDLVAIGDAMRRAKERYYLESPRYDAYDVKTSLQWTLFGFPMYAVRTGITPDTNAIQSKQTGDGTERFGPVTVTRQTPRTSRTSLPPHLVRLDLNFDFTAAGVHRKYNADGDVVAEPGCPHPEGCYYTLKGLVERASGESDLPLEPYFVYDSRLSGTSQHGALWLGSSYVTESGWTPVIGEMVTSNPVDTPLDPLPPRLFLSPRVSRKPRAVLDDGEGLCYGHDDELNSLVVPTGELVPDPDTPDAPQSAVHRLYEKVDLEILYFDNPDNPSENCDREGPDFGNGPFHELRGAELSFSVPASDPSGVWRLVVVWDDDEAGRWRPLELDYDAVSDTWTGSLDVAGRQGIVYVLQAVDKRGNVSWKQLVAPVPASGIPLGLADAVQVEVLPGSADLTVDFAVSPELVVTNERLDATVRAVNRGPGPASRLTADLVLPADFLYIGADANWYCELSGRLLSCDGSNLEAGQTSQLDVLLRAPGTGGSRSLSACVSAAESDPDSSNNCAGVDVVVVDESMTDLAVSVQVSDVDLTPGAPIIYSITVSNLGPNPADDALVEDVFPPELRDVTWTCAASVGSSCSPSGTGSILDRVDVAPGGTLLYTATATVAATAVGPVVNVATVEVPASMEDVVPGNNRSAVTVPGEVPFFNDSFESGDTRQWPISSGQE